MVSYTFNGRSSYFNTSHCASANEKLYFITCFVHVIFGPLGIFNIYIFENYSGKVYSISYEIVAKRNNIPISASYKDFEL